MTSEQWDALVAHARDDAPNECCGLLCGRDGAVEEVRAGREHRATRPTATSSTRAASSRVNELDDEGYEVGVYHSHPRSPAEPSQTDINLATYPDWTY